MLAKLGKNAVATSPTGEDLIRRKTVIVKYTTEVVVIKLEKHSGLNRCVIAG